MLLAQLSDLHVLAPGGMLSGLVATDHLLRQSVRALRSLDPAPDALLLTGDLVDSGLPAEYRHLREILAPLELPIYIIPGNHDERGALRAAFADHGYLPAEGPLRWCVELGACRLIGLDSTVPGAPGGSLDDENLDWLAQRLTEAPDRPTLVALHHPPYPSGIRHMDAIALAHPERLEAVIRRHPQVERILSGHLHRSTQARFGGTLATTCPSSAHQIELNLRPDHGGGFIMEPPGFQLHRWNPGAGLVTHVVPVGDFSGPHRFHG